MFKNEKLSFKIIAVAVIVLLTALLCVGTFSVYNKRKDQYGAPGNDNTIGEQVGGFITFLVDYDSEDDFAGGDSVSASQSSTTYATSDYTCTYIGCNTETKLTTGDKIYLNIHNDDAVSFSILIHSSSDEYIGTVAGVMKKNGKKFKNFDVGYNNGSAFVPVDKGVTSATIIVGSKYDPNYTGKIVIKVNVEAVAYYFYGYYDFNDGNGHQYSKNTKTTYNTEGVEQWGTISDSLVEQNLGSDYAFGGWYLDITILAVKGVSKESPFYGVPYKEMYYGKDFIDDRDGEEWTEDNYKPEISNDGKYYIDLHRYDRFGATITFEVKPDPWYDSEGHVCYDIVEGGVKGEARVFQGTNEPFIKARFVRTYDVTIECGESDWTNYPSGLDIGKDELYGVTTQTIGSNTTQINALKNYDFYFTEDRAFYHKSDMTGNYSMSEDGINRYSINNYGCVISGYIVKVGNQYLTWDQTNVDRLVTTDVITTLSVDDLILSEVGLDEIANLCDNLFSATSELAITITPVWETQSININNTEATVELFSAYQLTPGSAPNGKTVVSFYYETQIGNGTKKINYILYEGVWNYANIHHTDDSSAIGYIYYDEDNACYNLNLTEYYEDNIYKVSLNDYSGNTISGGRLDDGKTLTITYDEITVYDADDLGIVNDSLVSLNDSGYTFIDAYIKNEFDIYMDAYRTATETDSVGITFDIFKWVYTDANNAKYIFIANEQKLTNLPIYATDYSQTVMWKNSIPNFAWAVSEDLDVDVDEYNMDENNVWTYSDANKSLYSHAAYRFKVYQDPTANNAYISQWSAWFGASTYGYFSDYTLINNTTEAEVDGCVFDSEQAIKEGYSVVYTTNSTSALYVEKGDEYWTFEVESIDQYNENLYFISNVCGCGEFVQLRDQDGSTELPIIRLNLVWPNKGHNFTVDNSNNYWVNKDFTNVTFPTSSVTANLNFGGAYLKYNNLIADRVTIEDVKNNSTLKMMSSYENDMALSFKDVTDFGRYDYAVYNYGHYITGWKVSVVFKSAGKVDINKYYNGASLVDGDPGFVSSLIGARLGVVASCINDYYAYLVRSHGVNWSVGVTLTPAWQAASLNVTLSNASSRNITFGADYDFGSYVPTSAGQTFMCFAFNNDNELDLININGVWNYVSGKDNYVNNYKSCSSYKVYLKDVFADNIYRVNLNNLYLDDLYNEDLACATITLKASSGYTFKDEDLVNLSAITYISIDDVDYEFIYSDYASLSAEDKSKFVMDTYLFQLYQNKTNWENGVTDKTFPMFNKVYADGATVVADTYNLVLAVAVGANNTVYTLPSGVSLWMYISNNKEITTLPIFEGEYTQTLAWKDNSAKYYSPNPAPTDNEQITTIYEEQLEDVKEDVWIYNANSVQFSPVNAYRTRYYFEGSSTSTDPYEYEYVTGDWYLNPTTTELTSLRAFSVQGKLNVLKSEFDGWLFNLNNVSTINGYKNYSKNGNVFTINHGTGKTIINTEGQLMSGSHLYKITTMTGTDLLAQNSFTPLIMAKLNGVYNTNINNADVYWQGKVESPSSTVAGAMYTDGTVHVGGSKTSFNVAATIDYAYPFMSSILNKKSTVFYLQSDFQGQSLNNLPHSNQGAYYVYNYGHYITGWQIIVSGVGIGNTEEYYLRHNGSSLVVESAKNSTAINILVEKSVLFSHIAAVVDVFNADKLGINYEITLIPQWQAVEVEVKENSNSLGKFNFTKGYELDIRKTQVPVGKSLIAYEYISNALIAIDGVWNYASIPYSYYTPASLTTYGNTTHTIVVNPVFVNNIYRVNLNDVYLETLQQTDHATLTLDSNKTNYKFNSDAVANTEFTYKDSLDLYSFQTFNEFYNNHENKTIFLMDSYITVLSSKIVDWRSGLSSFGLFNKVYYTTSNRCSAHLSNNVLLNLTTQANTNWYVSNAVDGYQMWIYLAHEQTTSSMPVFNNDYAALIAWNDEKIGNYFETNAITSEKRLKAIQNTIKTNESNKWNSKWNYTGNNTQLTATYAFRTRYYYESKDTLVYGDEYSFVKGDWYYASDPTLLYVKEGANKVYSQIPDIDDLKPNKSIFYGWIFDIQEAQRRYGAANVTMSYDKIKITHASGKMTIISVDGKVVNNDKDLWYIVDILGSEILDQDPTRPIIKAKLGLIYNAEINNENVYWFNKLDDYKVAGVVTSYTKQNEDQPTYVNNTYKADLEIANTQNHAYPFMNSILNGSSSVFYHSNDYIDNVAYVPSADKGYYFVYNYGHYLSGWKIYLPSLQKYLIVNDSGDWEAVNATSVVSFVVSIDKLTDVNFANFAVVAAEADSIYADTIGDDLKIVLYPQWTASSIQVKHDAKTLFNTLLPFGTQLYTMNDNSQAVSAGKSLMAYAYNNSDIDNSLIAVTGRWNYAKIGQNFYAYDSEQASVMLGNVLYTLSVYPVLVDNVYAVELQNTRVNLYGVYELGEGYTFNNLNGFYDGQLGEKCLTFTNNFSTLDQDYRYKAYNNELLVDDYIEDLKQYKAMFLAGIDGDYQADFDLFNKVFFTSGNYVLDQENYNMLDNKDNTNKFYLYLANAQVCDYLPVFKNAYNNLIFWENSEYYQGKESYGKYAYITRDFLVDDEDHKNEISNFITRKEFDNSYKKLWYFTDGDGALNEALVAHYFRKNYYLDVKTTYQSQVDRRGYVLFDIYDTLYAVDNTIEDESGKYLVICENGQMEVYLLHLADISTFALKNLTQSGYATKLARVAGEDNIYIRLFAGCDVTMCVRDQSKDASSMSTGSYDEMIGYKFKTFTQKVSPEVDKTALMDLNSLQDKSSGYKFTTPATTWVQHDYKNKTILSIDVEFENILYDLIIKMQDPDTGRVEYALDGKITSQQASHSLTDLQCGNEVMSRYLSYAGFTLQDDAFVLYYSQGYGHTLQVFNDAEQANGDVAGQIHTFVIDGTWLRENLYNRYINNYAIYPNGTDEATKMGELTVQTEAIIFNFGFITRDYASYTDPNERIIDFENRYKLGNISLSRDIDGNYSTLTPTFNNYIVGSDRFAERTYWFYLGSVYYSLWESKLFYYNETSHAEQYVTQYSFPIMVNAPSIEHKINMSQIAAMVEVYEEGLIIANELRFLNLLLDISPYIEQSIYVQADLCEDNAGFTPQDLLQDPNRGMRGVQISYLHNDSTQTIQMAVNANASFDTSNRFVINYKSDSQAYTMLANNVLYYPAYVGMNLSIVASAQYVNDYISVGTYSMQSVDMSNRNIVLARCDSATSEKQNNGFEYVRFNAKPLHANYIYRFVDADGTTQVMSLAEISEYIIETEDLKTSPEKDLYVDKSCNAVTYEAKVKSSRYVLEVKISGISKGKSTLVSLAEQTAHIISVADYAKAQGDLVNVEVIVSANEASKITVVPIIAEYQNHLGLDNFGSYNILTENIIDGVTEKLEFNNLTGEQVLHLVDGEKVEITFNLAPGYRYVGFKYGYALINTEPLVDSKITIISSFDVNYHSTNGINQYFLVIEKIPVNATLDTSNSRAFYKINGYDNNAIVYIDQTITFDQINTINTERFVGFYYFDNQGEKVLLTTDGTVNGAPIMSFVLTGKMIECCNIITTAGDYVLTFYSEIIEKFETMLTLQGAEYLVDSSVYFKIDDEFENLLRLVDGKTIKYSAYFEKGTELNILAVALVEGKYNIKFNNNTPQDALNEIVVINEPTHLTVVVTPKQFEIIVNEKLYENLEQLDNGTPVNVTEDGMVNALAVRGLNFNEATEFTFVADKKQDRRLTQIVISGNDAEDETIIDLTNIDFKTLGSIIIDGYTLTFEQLTNNDIRAVVACTAKANITLELTYTQYKVINS